MRVEELEARTLRCHCLNLPTPTLVYLQLASIVGSLLLPKRLRSSPPISHPQVLACVIIQSCSRPTRVSPDRLDKPVSGLLLLAKTSAVAAKMRKLLEVRYGT